MSEREELRRELASALRSDDAAAIKRAAERCLATCTSANPIRTDHVARLLDLGKLVAEVVHELRQPLLGVKSLAQIVVAKPDHPDKVASKAAIIVDQAEKMEEIVNRLLQYAGAGPAAARRRRADINQVVSAAHALLSHALRQVRVTIATDLAPDLPEVAIDPLELQQIFVNLIGNARDALTGRQGEIRVSTAAGADCVEAVVADDGPGVSAEMRGRLFTPFASGREAGTGLGLHLSRKIAERAGGSIELIDSEAGAVFLLRLPIAETSGD